MDQTDVVLVGAGIMSATLGMLLKELQPNLKIEVFESLDAIATESSDAWNNAGTGHAALCELNYTPQRPDGTVDISKALEINESFEVSKQFWSYLVEGGVIADPSRFIQPVPHMSFVRGTANIQYLKKRYEALSESHLFSDMQYSEDPAELEKWIPLIMDGRSPNEKVAATRFEEGSDVNFGELTRMLFGSLQQREGVAVHLGTKVTSLRRGKDQRWTVTTSGRRGRRQVSARFVFLGAGGGALALLQKSGIPEGKGFGGFPVSGQFLRCDDQAIVEKHHAKVYGKAAVGSPPMSVPHLDTRVIDGKRALLFGPYAGFSTRFLKNGSLLDMPLSFKPDNVVPMLAAGKDNMDLTAYLIGQVLQSPKDRLEALKEFVPTAQLKDWSLVTAGQRVQVIKKSPTKGGVLQFGTEVVSAEDGSIAALLGASPGASTSVSIMLNLVARCFKNEAAGEGWQEKLKEMIPSHGESLANDFALANRIRFWTNETLGLRSDDLLAV